MRAVRWREIDEGGRGVPKPGMSGLESEFEPSIDETIRRFGSARTVIPGRGGGRKRLAHEREPSDAPAGRTVWMDAQAFSGGPHRWKSDARPFRSFDGLSDGQLDARGWFGVVWSGVVPTVGWAK